MKSATQQVLESIDELLAGQDDALILPMTTLNQATATVFAKNNKIITRMQDKILRAADKATTLHLDALDGVFTRVLEGLDTWQFDMNFLLTQLAAKGGFTKAGEPLEAALQAELASAPKLAYEGTLVLAVAEAIPYFEQLIHVLREIRDRLPAAEVRLPDEVPSGDDDEELIQADTTAGIGDDSTVDWPEV